MKLRLPAADWLRLYRPSWFTADLMAGLTVGVLLIPQGMAYALLAGLPPVYGLYAAVVPQLIYALFGTSRRLAVGPVAIDSLLVAAGVGALAVPGSAEYIGYAILLAFLAGTIQFFTGLFRLDFLVNFISRPVLSGFISAAAVVIATSQLGTILGLDLERSHVFSTLGQIFAQFDSVHGISWLLGGLSVVFLLFSKKYFPRLPAALAVVLFGIGASIAFSFESTGVAVIGTVPGGLPAFALPVFDGTAARTLLPTAFSIAFIGFMEAYAVGQTLQRRHRDYEIRSRHELMALGLANMIGSFFAAYPGTGGLSRSAVNDAAGAKTPISGLVSAALVVLTLLFLTRCFYHLPLPVLSAIIVTAVINMIDIATARRLWRSHRSDFWLFGLTAIGTLYLGAAEGIVLGVLLSLGVVIYRLSRPHYAVLGRSDEGELYRNRERFATVTPVSGALLFRFDAPLSYTNSAFFRGTVRELAGAQPDLRYFLLDARALTHIDATGMDTLRELIGELRQQEVELLVVNAIGPVRDLLYGENLIGLLGEDHLFNDLVEAVSWIEQRAVPTGELRGFATEHRPLR